MCLWEYKYSKNIVDSVIVGNEIINATDATNNTVSTNVTGIIPTNVMSTVSINSDDQKERYKMDFILHTFLSVTILLFIIAIICYHYTNHR